MPILTAFVLAAFVGYGTAWHLGVIEGNFALLLFLATLVTGLYWLAERLWFLPRRRLVAQQAADAARTRREELARQGIEQVDTSFEDAARERVLAQPWWLDWTAGLFPVILIVFLLVTFVPAISLTLPALWR